ncbi:fumarylacetoacetate hydrolase family protein [Streptomyces meridianus]|uniref:Fumarylacetoacetate hydrolase family protein n=1 Tax=Streptomyces meridianus TaxID=2938945 RepID=A0ABT0XCD2_9ACTN|nr:fumarylacetoacetate hydrolase family protein [Streptomyces meridianus]MCM2580040.1 fumarylacetoacetate hydrolase family protein [Streptomyces meridianus]
MQLMRLGPPGSERPAVRTADGMVHDLSGVTPDIDGAFLAGGGIDRVRKALEQGALPRVSDDGLRVGPPVARPAAVICVGLNYAAHAAESGAEPPKAPVVFFKHPGTLAGPDDETVIPDGSERTDWEVELAVVIGRRAERLSSPEEALRHIAGYAIANDLSERTWQLEHSGGQWSKGKCAPGFNPLGPWLVPADEIDDPQALRLRSWVNGEPRQDSTTADMIFPVARIVHHLSHYMALEPGDVIDTGTPEGVAMSGRFPYLKPGDVVELEIEELGRQRQVMTSGTKKEQAA